MHGIYVTEKDPSAATPVAAASGLPFVVGTAHIHQLESPAEVGIPTLVSDWADAVEKFGYSDNWTTYTLCEVMYSHFKLYGCSPVIFVNVLDPSTHKTAVTETTKTVSAHKVVLEADAINSSALVVKDGSDTLTSGTDYDAYYTDDGLVVELISTSTHYSATNLTVAYDKISTTAITASTIATAVETVEYCPVKLGITPDLLLAPGWSQETTVASALALKANGIAGMFKAKALIDIDSSATGATTVAAAVTKKGTDEFTDEAEIVCWPMAKNGSKLFHMSTLVAGVIAQVDSGNDSTPYESPSNKAIQATATCTASGTEVNLTYAQANTLNSAGIVTALSFLNGWTCWGNYTGCYPATTTAKDAFIAVSRMFDWVGNTLIKTFWEKLDKPMTRRLIDSIIDATNVWLNGLVGQGYLLGARVEFIDSENPLADLVAGKIKFHIYMTPPSPAQEIDFVLEYDADYVTEELTE